MCAIQNVLSAIHVALFMYMSTYRILGIKYMYILVTCACTNVPVPKATALNSVFAN